MNDLDRLRAPIKTIYAFYAPGAHLVKIGCSSNLEQRFRAHAKTFPDLEVLAVIPGSDVLERALHRALEAHRIPQRRGRRGWLGPQEHFHPRLEVFDFIQRVFALQPAVDGFSRTTHLRTLRMANRLN